MRITAFIFYILCLFVIQGEGAVSMAYLDGGTGSIIAQFIVGGIASVMVVAKLYWHQFKAFIARIRGKEIEKSALDTDDDIDTA